MTELVICAELVIFTRARVPPGSGGSRIFGIFGFGVLYQKVLIFRVLWVPEPPEPGYKKIVGYKYKKFCIPCKKIMIFVSDRTLPSGGSKTGFFDNVALMPPR